MPMPLSTLEHLAQPVVNAIREYLTAPGTDQRDRLENELKTALHLAYAKGKADAERELQK